MYGLTPFGKECVMTSAWEGRDVCITGGAGFIGSNLARRLVEEGARLRLVDNLERGRRTFVEAVLGDCEFVEGDLRDASVARRAVQGMDVVFHLASKVGSIQVYLNQPGTILTGNLLIDQQVLRACVEEGVPRVFYASSAHVYPEDRQQSPDAPPLVEADAYPAAPGISYGWAKLIGERALEGWAQEKPDLRVAIGRIVGAYGMNQDIGLDTASAIPAFCHRAARWPDLQPFRVLGTGTETRSYCFIDDVLDALIRSVEALEIRPVVGPFNLGNEGRNTIREIVETVIEASGKPIEMEFDSSFETPLWGQAVGCALAAEQLDGWKPAVSLHEGVQRTYDHIAERVARGEER